MKFLVGDEVRYIGGLRLGPIYCQTSSGDVGFVERMSDNIALSLPPKNYYRVNFGSDDIFDIIESDLELVSRPIESSDLEAAFEEIDNRYREAMDIVPKNWKKIIEHLESSIDIALENCEHAYAIEQAMILEEACKAYAGEKYSFEGKLNVQ